MIHLNEKTWQLPDTGMTFSFPTTNILMYLCGQNEALPWDLSMLTTPLTHDYDPTCCTFSNTTGATTNYTYDPGNSSINTGKSSSPYNYDNICGLHPGESRSTDKATYVDSWVYYYGYRYYNPELGRWVSRDPIAFSFNLYCAMRNAPLSKYDPKGLKSKPVPNLSKEKECNQAMEDFLDENPRWNRAIDYLSNPPRGSTRKPCTLDKNCVCCWKEKDEFGGLCTQMYDTTRERRIQIIICYNKSDNYKKTFAHELIHYFDRCTDRFDCEDTEPGQDFQDCVCHNDLCKEYRAYKITGYCTDPDSCWEKVINNSSINYWKYYKCHILAGPNDEDKERIKERLKSDCSLTEGMPPEPTL